MTNYACIEQPPSRICFFISRPCLMRRCHVETQNQDGSQGQNCLPTAVKAKKSEDGSRTASSDVARVHCSRRRPHISEAPRKERDTDDNSWPRKKDFAATEVGGRGAAWRWRRKRLQSLISHRRTSTGTGYLFPSLFRRCMCVFQAVATDFSFCSESV